MLRSWPFALLLVIVGAVAAGCQQTPSGARTSASAPAERRPSNVTRADYIGSQACAGCHGAIYAAWQRSPMHRMTRELAATEITAPFDGRSLRLGADEATLREQDGQRFIDLAQPGVRSLFRVTKVIGGRYREDFVGVEVPAEQPSGPALGEQLILPLSYLKFDGTLRYKGYSVMVPERHGLEPGLVWQRACILCHNTAPQLVAWYDELFGDGAPSYQGSASNELPPNRAFKYVIDDAEGLRVELERELHGLGARGRLPEDPRQALKIALSNTRERFSETALVELGVGCESCHGGSRAHATAPERFSSSFAAQSAFLHVDAPGGGPPTPAQDQSRSCAKCHTVLFSQYPFTWEGGDRRQHPGGSTTNSGEARDFLLGGCSTAMSCATCHDPHGEDDRQKLDALFTPDGNRVCTKCHGALGGDTALRRHAHHTPGGAGAVCVNCHMPKKNMGLAYEFTAYHRIGAPTDEARVLGDRPLECSLCHADRSVDQIVTTMEKWWGKRYDRVRLTRLYGVDLRKNPVRLALALGKPHEQALAADIAARHQLTDTTDAIVRLLRNPYPLVRYFARHSLELRFAEPLPLDMSLNGADLMHQAELWRAARGRPD